VDRDRMTAVTSWWWRRFGTFGGRGGE
jgi:hypothetical protein